MRATVPSYLIFKSYKVFILLKMLQLVQQSDITITLRGIPVPVFSKFQILSVYVGTTPTESISPWIPVPQTLYQWCKQMESTDWKVSIMGMTIRLQFSEVSSCKYVNVICHGETNMSGRNTRWLLSEGCFNCV
jgi:hypothetical protein